MEKDFMNNDLSAEKELEAAFRHADRVEREAMIRVALRKMEACNA